MSLAVEIANAVRTRFYEEVVGGEDGLLVVYDNVPDAAIPSNSRWVRFSVRLGEQRQVSVASTGGRRFRTAGVALVHLFEPIGIGDGAQLALVATIQDAFRSVSLDGPPFITFDPPYVSAAPIREDSWWLLPVVIPFRADEYA